MHDASTTRVESFERGEIRPSVAGPQLFMPKASISGINEAVFRRLRWCLRQKLTCHTPLTAGQARRSTASTRRCGSHTERKKRQLGGLSRERKARGYRVTHNRRAWWCSGRAGIRRGTLDAAHYPRCGLLLNSWNPLLALACQPTLGPCSAVVIRSIRDPRSTIPHTLHTLRRITVASSSAPLLRCTQTRSAIKGA